MHHIGQCHARVLIISARRQFPPGARVAGSLIYIKTKGMVGYAVSRWISPTCQGTCCGALRFYQNDRDSAETNPHAGLAFGPALQIVCILVSGEIA